MPNCCCGYVKVKGAPENVKEFCRLFIFNEGIENEAKQYFARSFMICSLKSFLKEQEDNFKIGIAEFPVEFAWSAHSCLIDGYPSKDNKINPTLMDMCKKYKVNVEISTEESGFEFCEEITCNSNGELVEKCFDFVTYKCKKCGYEEGFAYNRDECDMECSECDGSLGWEKIE
jgi:hypothetical protein